MLAIVNALLPLFVTVLPGYFAAWHHDADSALAKALNGMVMTYALLGRWRAALVNAASAAGPPLLFGLRLWASVCLALHVAFWLELDNAYWAGASAALMCQPHLGASLRKGWFRMIGTLVGAVAIVLLTAWFPQNRTGFLVGLPL